MMGAINKMSAEQFRACQQSPDYCVVDVRDRDEFANHAEPNSYNWPLNTITADTAAGFVKEHTLLPSQTIVVLCTRGMRASVAAEKLQQLLPNPIVVLDGGHNALAPADAPMSIERQVRIAAGSLVLLGVIGSMFVHPSLLGISAFVGAGLVFAGVTDWCGMGLLLLKMPWNRRA
jgi:rhodanese-related sulfurtransferase